jgi:hypothetical protein
VAHDLVTELLQYSSLACFMAIGQLCANLLIPNCLRSNLSYSPLAALELCVNNSNSFFYKMKITTNHPHPYRNGKVGGVHQMKVTTFFRVNLLKTIRQYRVVSSVNIYYLEMFVEG